VATSVPLKLVTPVTSITHVPERCERHLAVVGQPGAGTVQRTPAAGSFTTSDASPVPVEARGAGSDREEGGAQLPRGPGGVAPDPREQRRGELVLPAGARDLSVVDPRLDATGRDQAGEEKCSDSAAEGAQTAGAH
jgi:hypothetical protein